MGRYVAAIAALVVIGTTPAYAQNTQFVVTTASADVHKAPSTGSAVLGTATRGKTFEVRHELGSWVSVAWPGADNGVGYLHVAWGRLSSGVAVQAPVSTAPASSAAATRSPAPSRSAGELRPAAVPLSETAPLSATAPAAESESGTRASDVQIAQSPRASSLPPSGLRLPSHVIGLGGRLGTHQMGMALAARAWTHGPLGVQIEAGQSTYSPGAMAGQLRSMQVAPSVIFSPPGLVTNALWARPYIGGGVNLHRATLRSAFGGADEVDNVFGSHIVAGTEFTWANVPQFAVSADVRHEWAPATFDDFDDFDLGGFAMAFSAHWYVK